MRILLAAIAATCLTAAVTPAAAATTAKSTIVLSDGTFVYISGRCPRIMLGGAAHCVNRVMGQPDGAVTWRKVHR
ncbi:MAG: hypothetical protein AAGK37_11880 [Pseudomonadota bacterium]